MTDPDPEPGTPEYELAQVEANFAFEGIFFTQAERELMLRYFRGEISRSEYEAVTDERVLGRSTDQDSRPDS